MSMPPPGSPPSDPNDPAAGGGFPPPGFPPPSQPEPTFPPPGQTGYPPPPPPDQPPGGFPPPGGYAPPGGGYAPPGSFPPPSGGFPPPAGGFGVPMGNLPGPLAEWPQRALGGLVDYVAPTIAYGIFARISGFLAFIAWLGVIGWYFYNAYLKGQTGQSIGNKIAGVKVVAEQTGQPIGGGMGIVRGLAHIIDSFICYVGWLFPLWDSKKQTIADKIMKTVAVSVPK